MSQQSYLEKASARGPRGTAPWFRGGPRASVEKPWSRPFDKVKKHTVNRPLFYAALVYKLHEMMRKKY